MAHVYGSKNSIGCLYLLSSVFGTLSHFWFVSVCSRLAGPVGMQRLQSLSLAWERWSYRSTPSDPALCNHGNSDSGPTLATASIQPALPSFHPGTGLLFPAMIILKWW